MSPLRELCLYVGSTITADFVARTLGMTRARASTRLSNLRRDGLLQVEGTVKIIEPGSGRKVQYRYRVAREA